MPNAQGRAATKRTPAKKATPAAAADASTEPKAERHVRTPLERAQSVYDKAKVASDKIATRLTAAKAEVTKLEEEAKEAKVTLDWAASHPLLVKARADAEDESVAAEIDEAEAAREADTEEGEPTGDADATPVDAATEEGEPTGDLAGEPAAPVDVFEQEPAEGEGATPAAAPFPFDQPPATPEQPNGTPFDFEQGRITRV